MSEEDIRNAIVKFDREDLLYGNYEIDIDAQVEVFLTIKQMSKFVKQKEVIDRILNETKETRDILNNNRDDNMLSKCCLLSYLEIVEDLLKEVSE